MLQLEFKTAVKKYSNAFMKHNSQVSFCVHTKRRVVFLVFSKDAILMVASDLSETGEGRWVGQASDHEQYKNFHRSLFK